MSCAPFDLRDYFFGELTAGEAKQVDGHIASCQVCRTEVSRMDVTRVAMMTLPMEEPPRRIAFVSDKVFEPTLWQRFWRSGPVVGFASAAMVTAGLFFNGAARPATTPVVNAPVASVDYAAIEANVRQQIAKQIPVEVAKAVAQVEERDRHHLTLAMANLAKTCEEKYELDVRAMQASLEINQRKVTKYLMAAADRQEGTR